MAKPIIVIDIQPGSGDPEKIEQFIKDKVADEYHVIVRIKPASTGEIFCLNPDNITGSIDIEEIIKAIST